MIIVDDGSADRTKEIVKESLDVKLIEGQHKGPCGVHTIFRFGLIFLNFLIAISFCIKPNPCT